ncbi:MAG: DegT/DnrJ/EryC1/StrS family aminotransferase [Armatimonadetes bacterium]|nr:DegT/DnrJ/EryC1/StrS family aminotransferase [Armatimonadota bacterium]
MTLEKIPLLDLKPEIDEIRDDIMAAVTRVIDSTAFIMGPDVKAFEEQCAAYLGVKHAVGVNSGTDALVLGIHAMGIRPGDEVITTPFTFFATGECISHMRATPIFVDIDPNTFNLDVDQVEAKITPRTKAIVPVHLYGHAVDMDPLMALAKKHNLLVLEDVAQAWGSEYKGTKVGTIGDAGAYSFFPSKNLGAFGDGGLFVTNNDELADTVRMLRVHGARKKYHNETVGANSRLDTLQAAILRAKLPHIDRWNEGRRAAAARYNEYFSAVPGVITPSEADYTKHVYHQYTIRIEGGKRDAVQAFLNERNIGSFVYYPVPLDKLPVYKNLPPTELPVSDLCTSQALSLPIWPSIASDVQKRVVDSVAEALK